MRGQGFGGNCCQPQGPPRYQPPPMPPPCQPPRFGSFPNFCPPPPPPIFMPPRMSCCPYPQPPAPCYPYNPYPSPQQIPMGMYSRPDACQYNHQYSVPINSLPQNGNSNYVGSAFDKTQPYCSSSNTAEPGSSFNNCNFYVNGRIKNGIKNTKSSTEQLYSNPNADSECTVTPGDDQVVNPPLGYPGSTRTGPWGGQAI